MFTGLTLAASITNKMSCCSSTFLLLLISLLIGVNSELFADTINEQTYLSPNVTVIHSCRFNFSICSKMSLTISYDYQLHKHFYYTKPNCVSCNLIINQSDRTVMSRFYKSVFSSSMASEYYCAPQYWNRDPLFIISAKLTLFMIADRFLLQTHSKNKYGKERMQYDLIIPDPYSRNNCFNLNDACTNFGHDLMFWSYKTDTCALVPAPFIVTTDPFVAGKNLGLYIPQFDKTGSNEYNNYIRYFRENFTISMWIFVDSSCSEQFCALLNFINNQLDTFTAPIVLLTRGGKFHVQGRMNHNGEDNAFITLTKVPLRKWLHFIFAANPYQWSLWLYDENNSEVLTSKNIQFTNPVSIDIIKYVGIVGGSRYHKGFTGLVSDIVIYPSKYLDSKTVLGSVSQRSFLSYKMMISQINNRCSLLAHEIQFNFDMWRLRQKQLKLRQEGCNAPNFMFKKRSKLSNTCAPRLSDVKRPSLYRKMQQLMKRVNYNEYKTWDFEQLQLGNMSVELSEFLLDRVWHKIKTRTVRMTRLMETYLFDSFCLSNSEAGYILSAAYFYGIGSFEINNTKTFAILLQNTLKHDHRLSMLALGNLFYNGIISNRHFVSWVYYQAMAEYTKVEADNPEIKDMFIDIIRLTNEEDIKQHTEEDGELFHWIQHQAEAGVPWAKEKLGRMFYWGQNGIKRNFNKAIDYFRQAAENPNANHVNHFDYGILLVKSNNDNEKELGRQELEKASKKDNRALTALGWLHESKHNDKKTAFDYYLKASKLGNVDSTYNVGIYYDGGVPDVVRKDKKIAFRHFERAALSNQVHAGYMYSQYLITGIYDFLEPHRDLALEWSRSIGEKSSKTGLYLSEGVRAYRKRNIPLSVIYYLLSALTGLELAVYNTAFLCDEHKAIVSKFVKHECTWYHYNMSLQRQEHMIHATSLIKMGDLYWYGYMDKYRNLSKSIDYYIRAAQKRDYQAYFNLGYVVEKYPLLINITKLKTTLHISLTRNENESDEEWFRRIALALYERCEKGAQQTEYMACGLASHRIKMAQFIYGPSLRYHAKASIGILLTILVIWQSTRLFLLQSQPNEQNNAAVFP